MGTLVYNSLNLGIDYTNQITLGELIAIAISFLGGFALLILWVRKKNAPSRMYDLSFLDGSSGSFPPGYVYSQPFRYNTTTTSETNGIAEIRARVRALQGVDIEEIGFRLVNRNWCPSRPSPFPLWMWQGVRPSTEGVFVTNLWDAEWEREQSIDPHRLARGQPHSLPDDSGGYRLNFGQARRRILARDSLWIRVIIQAGANWNGHLEFQGPSQDQQRAYRRRHVTLVFNSDMKGTQGR